MFQATFALLLIEVVGFNHRVNIGRVEVVLTIFDLLPQQNIAVGLATIPVDLPDAIDVLEIHRNPLQAVGQLDSHRIKLQTAGLLKIGVLADLHAIEPHLPAQAPGPQRRAFPVVLDKADVVFLPFEADSVEAAQVKRLGIAGIGLQDDLKLSVHLHTVGIVAKATIVGPEGGFDVGNVPRLRSQNPQRRARIGRARADRFVPGLPDQRALLGPILLQGHNDLLKIEWL